MKYKITLTYFKLSGKYYTSADYLTEKEYMHQVFEEVEDMRINNRLPGLQSGNWQEGFIHVNAENHPNGYPGLIV